MVATKKGSKKSSKGSKKSSKSKRAMAPGTKIGVKRAVGTKLAVKKARPKPVKGNCLNWIAIQNMMPPGPWSITVRGTCKFPNHYHTVKLTKAVPQGKNPAYLLLKKTVTSTVGIQIPQVVSFTYTMKTKQKYTHVTILPDMVTFKVQHVF